MIKKLVTVIDYGVGNILSLTKALEWCNAKVLLTKDKKKILSAGYIILPGVGAFGSAMDKIKELDLFDTLKTVSNRGNFLLGICLGMQLLMNKSFEFGENQGLSIIPGDVVLVPKVAQFKKKIALKVPYIGWFSMINKINKFNLMQNNKFYFIHSFTAVPNNKKHILSFYNYYGNKVTSIINKNNIYGCQFHPEKSGKDGLKFLNNFLTLKS